jgi:hypothetical protein
MTPPEPADSEPPDPTAPAPDPPPKLVPFLQVVAPVAPAPAAVKGYAFAPPPGLDPRKGGKAFPLKDGTLYAVDYPTGPNDSQWLLSIVRGGVEVRAFPQVTSFSVDASHDRLALQHTKPGPLSVRAIVDLATSAETLLPQMPCTDRLSWADDGKLLLGNGFVHDYAVLPGSSQVWVCLFDASGKLLTKLDGGRHNHHAGAADYVRDSVGVLAKDPFVVFLTREYEPYGNFDVTFIDTRPPHARKVARLSTPAKIGVLEDLEIDVSTLTLSDTEVRFRGKRAGTGAWWKWQTAPLIVAP